MDPLKGAGQAASENMKTIRSAVTVEKPKTDSNGFRAGLEAAAGYLEKMAEAEYGEIPRDIFREGAAAIRQLEPGD